ncbi:unnamed protein product [Dracunculus medinensis]|uniref:Transmembrane protein 273 n=1 Tax=Dracunculus medinensis TaxID=318479 RepID=A0A0N4UFK8_DRAME|nr:unnamed protein product [Dracunculus medinensis]
MVLMRDLLIKSSALNIEILKLICILCVTVSKMFLPILLLLNLLLDVKGDSCLSNNDLAGLVLGTSLATLLITGCITIFTCFLVRKRQLAFDTKRKRENFTVITPDVEKANQRKSEAIHENGDIEMENKTTESKPTFKVDKVLLVHLAFDAIHHMVQVTKYVSAVVFGRRLVPISEGVCDHARFYP